MYHRFGMTFYALGLNHETAPVAVREAFALDEARLRALYQSLGDTPHAERMVLSTCNRTEVYLYGTEAEVVRIRTALAALAGHPWPEAMAFQLEDEAAVQHLLYVACGLRSMVLGDAQILAQVKDAYRVAVEEDQVGSILHRLLHTAFRAAKRVIHETALTDGTASVAGTAVALALEHVAPTGASDLKGRRVLVLGAGEMGRAAARLLAVQAPDELIITNRTREAAETLAAGIGATVAAWDERYAAIQNADVVLVTTGAETPVLLASEMPALAENQPPKLLIDLAIPRNVDPALDAAAGYEVIDLDVLHREVEAVQTQRQAEVPAAQQICAELLQEFVAWVFHQQGLQPAIEAIRDSFEAIRLQEIERHHHRFEGADREELDRLTRSIMQKLLAIPIVRLKNVHPDSVDFVRGIKLLQALFTRADCEDESALAVPPLEQQREQVEARLQEAQLQEARLQEAQLQEALRLDSKKRS